MSKQLGLGIIAVILIAVIAGGTWYVLSQQDKTDSTSETQTTTTTVNEEVDKTSTEEAVSLLEGSGMVVSEQQQINELEAARAESGVQVQADGTLVEIYDYATVEDLLTGAEALRGIHNPQVVTVFELDNFVVVVHSADEVLVERVRQAIDT